MTPEGSLPPEFQSQQESIRIMGFWIFLATDVVLFGSLFSVYAVFRHRVALGPTPHHIFAMGPVLAETLILLTSSFTCSLSLFFARRGSTKGAVLWLWITVLLGVSFVFLEIHEFVGDVLHGFTWHLSAFLSSFFTLVGTHGSHVTVGIAWAIMLSLQMAMRGLTLESHRKLYTFALYWHFLDIVWIFIFSVVYLSGMAS